MTVRPPLAAAQTAYREAITAYQAWAAIEAITRMALNRAFCTAPRSTLEAFDALCAGHVTRGQVSDLAALDLYEAWQTWHAQRDTRDAARDALLLAESVLRRLARTARNPE